MTTELIDKSGITGTCANCGKPHPIACTGNIKANLSTMCNRFKMLGEAAAKAARGVK